MGSVAGPCAWPVSPKTLHRQMKRIPKLDISSFPLSLGVILCLGWKRGYCSLRHSRSVFRERGEEVDRLALFCAYHVSAPRHTRMSTHTHTHTSSSSSKATTTAHPSPLSISPLHNHIKVIVWGDAEREGERGEEAKERRKLIISSHRRGEKRDEGETP